MLVGCSRLNVIGVTSAHIAHSLRKWLGTTIVTATAYDDYVKGVSQNAR